MSRVETLKEQQRGFSNLSAEWRLRGAFQVANGECRESSMSEPHIKMSWQKKEPQYHSESRRPTTCISTAVQVYMHGTKRRKIRGSLTSTGQHASPRNRSHSYPRPGSSETCTPPCSGGHNCAAPSRVMPRRTNAAVVEMAHPESPHGSERFTKELKCTVMQKRTSAQAKGLVPIGSGTFLFLEQFGTQSIRTRIGISLLWLVHPGDRLVGISAV